MGSKRKSWREKLHVDKGLPKVIVMDGSLSQRWGEGTCVIPAPIDVDALMRRVPKGKLATLNQLREALAQQHSATIACPITTGIFAWIAAHAAAEGTDAGQSKTTAYWRTLKTGGELNPKYPGGIEGLRKRLESEGHTVVQKGRRFFVENLESKLVRSLAPKPRSSDTQRAVKLPTARTLVRSRNRTNQCSAS